MIGPPALIEGVCAGICGGGGLEKSGMKGKDRKEIGARYRGLGGRSPKSSALIHIFQAHTYNGRGLGDWKRGAQ